jgi:hypothetical protein
MVVKAQLKAGHAEVVEKGIMLGCSVETIILQQENMKT